MARQKAHFVKKEKNWEIPMVDILRKRIRATVEKKVSSDFNLRILTLNSESQNSDFNVRISEF